MLALSNLLVDSHEILIEVSGVRCGNDFATWVRPKIFEQPHKCGTDYHHMHRPEDKKRRE